MGKLKVRKNTPNESVSECTPKKNIWSGKRKKYSKVNYVMKNIIHKCSFKVCIYNMYNKGEKTRLLNMKKNAVVQK